MKTILPIPSHPLSLAQLSPAYFGLVMATGIVAIGAFLMGLAAIAQGLFFLNCLQYGVLCLLYLARAVLYPQHFCADLFSHLKGPGFFTSVAGTAILASQCVLQGYSIAIAKTLWLLAVVLWLLLTYSIFTALTIKKDKPSLDQGINGGWLLAVVASQAISVSISLLLPHWHNDYQQELSLLALAMWLWGGMLYIWIMSLIFYRYNFFRFSASDLSPPYWINMGAMAIATLAGSLLIQHAESFALIQSLLPFIKGFTLLFWVTGTWWIPMLLLLGFWRHILQRFPIRYDPLYWGMVFPLGMYAVCTHELGQALQLPFLAGLAKLFLYLALIAWLSTFLAMLLRLIERTYRARNN